jgi:hypothetical protein
MKGFVGFIQSVLMVIMALGLLGATLQSCDFGRRQIDKLADGVDQLQIKEK